MGLHAKKKEQRKNFAFPKIGYKKYTSKEKKKNKRLSCSAYPFIFNKKKINIS